MQCAQVSDHLLLDEPADHAAVAAHLAACVACSRLARVSRRVDQALHAALVVAPPPALQAQLAALVAEHSSAPPPAPAPWWRRTLTTLREWDAQFGRSNMSFAQGLVMLAVALASWQVFSWAGSVTPMVGDVGYAMQVVATSPALAYVPDFQLDPTSLGVWTLVGAAGWAVSESGPLGRFLDRSRDRS